MRSIGYDISNDEVSPGNVMVLGAGSWGTALANSLAHNLTNSIVHLGVRSSVLAEEITKSGYNNAYLPEVKLAENIAIFHASALHDDKQSRRLWKNIIAVLVAVPAQAMRDNLPLLYGVPPGCPVISLAKGLELSTGKRMSELIDELIPTARSGTFAGPNLASEVAARLPTAAVLALHKKPALKKTKLGPDAISGPDLCKLLSSERLAVLPSTDVVGVEICGAAKNIIALACGIADGLGHGDNTVAAIVTAGFKDISRLCAAMGARPETMVSPAGLGDLAATCYSDKSRNRAFGRAFVQAFEQKDSPEVSTLDLAASHSGQVVESIPTLAALVALGEEVAVPLPVINTVYMIIQEFMEPAEGIYQLVQQSIMH